MTARSKTLRLPALIGSAAAIFAATSGAMAAPREADTILVKLDRDATSAERSSVTRALDAEASRGLPAGWRAYRVPEDMTLAEARDRLQATNADRAVELDGVVHANLTPNDARFSLLYGLQLVDAPTAWDTPPQGPPIVVAISDTGVDVTHPDLAPMIWTNPAETPNGLDDDLNGYVDDIQGWDFYGNDATVFDDPTIDEHGTHVAGTIGAVRNNSFGVAGVADNVRLMPAKFLGSPDSSGPVSAGIAAIAYARQNGARIINASWGSGSHSQALCDAVAAATADGVLFVAAAGNDAENNDAVVSEPADCPGAISVAATNSVDGLAGFSNIGPSSVHLGAPGVTVDSTLPGGTYGAFSGTSMATPHVSGAAALVLGQVPAAGPEELRAALLDGGDAVASLTATTSSGRRLNVVGAINQAILNQGGTPPPDTSPPTSFSLATPSDGATVAARPTFTWAKAIDTRSGIAKYRLVVDGALVAETPAGTQKFTPEVDLAEGHHTWLVEAEDGAGNRRATAPREIMIDAGPPQPFVLEGPTAGKATKNTRPTFTWGASADPGAGLAGYRLVIDGTMSPTLSPETRSATPDVPLTNGSHLWKVEAVDRLGRIQASEERSVIVDTLAPATFSLRSPSDGRRLRVRRPGFSWNVAKDAVGGVTYEVVLNGKVRATGITGTGWRPLSALRPGYYGWTVNAIDAAGNVRASLRETFGIAKPKPKKKRKK